MTSIRPKNPVNREFINLMADIIALFAVSFLGIYGIITASFYENLLYKILAWKDGGAHFRGSYGKTLSYENPLSQNNK